MIKPAAAVFARSRWSFRRVRARAARRAISPVARTAKPSPSRRRVHALLQTAPQNIHMLRSLLTSPRRGSGRLRGRARVRRSELPQPSRPARFSRARSPPSRQHGFPFRSASGFGPDRVAGRARFVFRHRAGARRSISASSQRGAASRPARFQRALSRFVISAGAGVRHGGRQSGSHSSRARLPVLLLQAEIEREVRTHRRGAAASRRGRPPAASRPGTSNRR